MKNNEKGFVGIDATVGMIVILIFMSILAVLFYNIKIDNKGTEREAKAVSIATGIIETLKSKQYAQVELAEGGKGAVLQKSENTYQYTSTDSGANVTLGNLNIEQGYTVHVKVENYFPEGENLDLIKIITVTVEYKLANEIKEISISTAIGKNVPI